MAKVLLAKDIGVDFQKSVLEEKRKRITKRIVCEKDIVKRKSMMVELDELEKSIEGIGASNG